MPYWGVALSIGPNYNDAAVDAARAQATHDAVKSAEQRAGNASQRERDYIAALGVRYPSPEPAADWLGFHREYSEAMREMVAKYPDDLDAATMFAESLMMLRPWQLWSLEGEPAPGTLELVDVLESVLRRNPEHPGANHFYIHAVEASRNLERAIPSAMRLMTLTPGAGHLVHMPGHIFLQTGDFDLAAETNVKASAADRAFIERTGATGVYPLMYWTHNLHFVAYARAQQGRYEEAKQAAEEMVANVGDGDREMQMLEGFRLYPLMVDLRFHQWDTILETSEPERARALSHAFWRYARAMALAGKGRARDAQAEQRRFERERAAVPPEGQYLINNKAGDLLALAAATLDAQVLAARGLPNAAVDAWAPRRDARRRAPIRRTARVVLHGPPKLRVSAAAWRRPRGCGAGVPRGARHSAAGRPVVVWLVAGVGGAGAQQRSHTRAAAICARLAGRDDAADGRRFVARLPAFWPEPCTTELCPIGAGGQVPAHDGQPGQTGSETNRCW